MSYCRKDSDFDVYVYPMSRYDKDLRRIVYEYVCCDCPLSATDVVTRTSKAMIEHLQTHEQIGHKVPEKAIRSLKKER